MNIQSTHTLNPQYDSHIDIPLALEKRSVMALALQLVLATVFKE